MKFKEIIGENYLQKINKTRIGCRGIVIKDNKLLLSYETKTGIYMLPGGGLENGESDAECCIRELKEETGLLVEPTECLLEMHEYYGENKFIHKYFKCNIVGVTNSNLTKLEQEVGMQPRWLFINEAKEFFSNYKSYTKIDEMRKGLYYREYTALCEMGL